MGVKDLWSVLSSVCEERPLAELAGKTLAVDLSGWVCQALTAKGLSTGVSKPHLRNLFYRVQSLLRVGADLVFVVDGQATQLKWAAMDQRSFRERGRGRGACAVERRRKTGVRSNLNRKIKECCSLLDILGVPYLQSKGEAEAYCALLNSTGLVHGVLTEDNDAFLYGATVVYRHLSTDQKVQQVSCYRMSRIHSELGLSRSALVSLALLLGCDYCPGGVPGVGKESALKLLHSCQEADPECDLLQRLRGWREEGGDVLCPVEDQIRRKARKVPGFPSEQVISEFLEYKDTVPSDTALKWRMPLIKKLQLFCLQHLDWPVDYSHGKALPLLSQWKLRQERARGRSGLHTGGESSCASVVSIVRTRVQNRVPYYEVNWEGDSSVCGLACEWLSGQQQQSATPVPASFLFTTLERSAQFEEAYPEISAAFIEQQEKTRRKGSKGMKKSSRSHTLVDEVLSDQLQSLKLSTTEKQTSSTGSDSSLSEDELPLLVRLKAKKQPHCTGHNHRKESAVSEDSRKSELTQKQKAVPQCVHSVQQQTFSSSACFVVERDGRELTGVYRSARRNELNEVSGDSDASPCRLTDLGSSDAPIVIE